jgi:cation-transporting ATPase 13A1
MSARRGCILTFPYRVQPVQQLSKERPLPSILNLYVLFSILLQFAIHMVSMIYMTNLAKANHE